MPPFELGVDGDYKECQAMTLMFLVGNIPEKYKDGLMIYEKLNPVYEKAGYYIAEAIKKNIDILDVKLNLTLTDAT